MLFSSFRCCGAHRRSDCLGRDWFGHEISTGLNRTIRGHSRFVRLFELFIVGYLGRELE